MHIHSQADLDRANIQVAWSFADRMSAEHFEELCRVTVRQLGRERESDVRGSTFEAVGTGCTRERSDDAAGL